MLNFQNGFYCNTVPYITIFEKGFRNFLEIRNEMFKRYKEIYIMNYIICLQKLFI